MLFSMRRHLFAHALLLVLLRIASVKLAAVATAQDLNAKVGRLLLLPLMRCAAYYVAPDVLHKKYNEACDMWRSVCLFLPFWSFGLLVVFRSLQCMLFRCWLQLQSQSESFFVGVPAWMHALSLGVVMFVMLFGYPPFYADENKYGAMTDSVIFALIEKGFDPSVKRGGSAHLCVLRAPVSCSSRAN